MNNIEINGTPIDYAEAAIKEFYRQEDESRKRFKLSETDRLARERLDKRLSGRNKRINPEAEFPPVCNCERCKEYGH